MLMPPTTPARAVGVLLVDDDTELGELGREYLAREGFSLEVEGDVTSPSVRSTRESPMKITRNAGPGFGVN
jgi:hypothetical protein